MSEPKIDLDDVDSLMLALDLCIEEFTTHCVCGGKPMLNSRQGGFSVDCEFSSPLTALFHDRKVCYIGDNWEFRMYPTPRGAIRRWQDIMLFEALYKEHGIT